MSSEPLPLTTQAPSKPTRTTSTAIALAGVGFVLAFNDVPRFVSSVTLLCCALVLGTYSDYLDVERLLSLSKRHAQLMAASLLLLAFTNAFLGQKNNLAFAIVPLWIVCLLIASRSSTLDNDRPGTFSYQVGMSLIPILGGPMVAMLLILSPRWRVSYWQEGWLPGDVAAYTTLLCVLVFGIATVGKYGKLVRSIAGQRIAVLAVFVLILLTVCEVISTKSWLEWSIVSLLAFASMVSISLHANVANNTQQVGTGRMTQHI